MRELVNALLKQNEDDMNLLPSYSKVQNTLIPVLQKHCFAQCTNAALSIDLRKSGTHLDHSLLGSRHDFSCTSALAGQVPTCDVVFVKPSEWVRLDVSFNPIWEEFKKSSWVTSDV